MAKKAKKKKLDACAKKVRDFEDQEELRRVKLINLVKDEANILCTESV